MVYLYTFAYQEDVTNQEHTGIYGYWPLCSILFIITKKCVRRVQVIDISDFPEENLHNATLCGDMCLKPTPGLDLLMLLYLIYPAFVYYIKCNLAWHKLGKWACIWLLCTCWIIFPLVSASLWWTWQLWYDGSSPVNALLTMQNT